MGVEDRFPVSAAWVASRVRGNDLGGGIDGDRGGSLHKWGVRPGNHHSPRTVVAVQAGFDATRGHRAPLQQASYATTKKYLHLFFAFYSPIMPDESV